MDLNKIFNDNIGQPKREQMIQAVKESAKDLFEGLAALRDLPGSRFEFDTLADDEMLTVRTNIPNGYFPVLIEFYKGEVRTFNKHEHASAKLGEDLAGVMAFVVRQAARHGLVSTESLQGIPQETQPAAQSAPAARKPRKFDL